MVGLVPPAILLMHSHSCHFRSDNDMYDHMNNSVYSFLYITSLLLLLHTELHTEFFKV